MAQFDPEKWAHIKALNPPPSWGEDPGTWPSTPMDLDNPDFGRAYGWCVVLFAQRWADEMERLLAESRAKTVADVAAPAAELVDASLGRWGLTGFQYGCAVSQLVRVWIHGEALRRWHNLDTQIGTEGEQANESGGILNPALLHINVSQDTPEST